VTVTDPNGQKSTLTATQAINAIPGTYTIIASPVVVGTNTYHATEATQMVAVSSGATSAAIVDYYDIVPSTTKVLDQAGQQSLTVSSDGSTVTISRASEIAQSLQVGNVLASAPTSSVPNGLLVNILSVSSNGSTVVAGVSQATLEEAIERGSFIYTQTYSTSSGQSVVSLLPGSRILTAEQAKREGIRYASDALPNACSTDSNAFVEPFAYTMGPQIGISNGDTGVAAAGQVLLSGTLEFCPQLQVSAQWDSLTLKSAQAVASFGEHAMITAQGELTVSYTAEQDVAKLTQPVPTVLAIGGVPVALQAQATLYVGSSLNAAASFSANVEQDAQAQAGLAYANGTTTPIQSVTDTIANDGTSLDGPVSGNLLYVGFKLGVLVDGFLLPNIATDAYINGEAGPPEALSWGLESNVGLDVSIIDTSIDIGLSSPELNLFSQPIWEESGSFDPSLGSVIPHAANEGSSDVSIALAGSNFVPDSVVNFSGVPLSTTFSAPGSMTAVIPASDLRVPGSYLITVTSPDTVGAASNAFAFTVNGSTSNPVPTISGLNPSSLVAGTPPQSLTINGMGFLASSTVKFNGIAHPATFVSTSELTISLTSADLATAGAYPVVVTNPTPGGGSATATFTVTASTSGVSISPSSITAPAGAVQTFAATVSGGGSVTWSVQEGAAGGSITPAGIYTAPSTLGTFHVVAVNSANSAQTATATVKVITAVSYSTLYSFPFAFESASLVQGTDGNLYGTTEMIAYKLDGSGNLTQLAQLSSSPAAPISSLIQATDSNFYGVDSQGSGSIFRLTPSGQVTTMYSFPNPSPDSVTGLSPWAGLVQGTDGNFYGTTYSGGNQSCTPHGYGVPAYGPYDGNPTYSASGCGTVFRMDSTGTATVLYSFSGQSDGNYPQAALIVGSDGNLYGTTTAGGAFGFGVVFTTDASGNLKVLHSFSGADGNGPVASLLQAYDGKLYGTTACQNSCTGSGGEVFRLDTSGNNFAVLHTFSGPDGWFPVAPLIQGSDGNFYGTTWSGGDLTCGIYYFNVGSGYPYPDAPGCGTVFKMDSGGNITVLHTFGEPQSGDGNAPYAGLLFGKDGYLYGTTYYGGASIYFGTVFRLSVPNN
jgi:uncharacterized repeat protein (TIGR03803 family)